MLRFALLATALLPFAAQAQEAKSFKDWSVMCDHGSHCTIFGFGPDTGDVTAHLRLERARQPDAPLEAWIVYTEAAEQDRQVRLTLDGAASPGLPADPQALPKGERRVALPVGDAFIQALRKGSKIEVDDGQEKAPVSLSGAVAALTWMDDRQGRVGTPSALIAKTGKGAPGSEPVAPILRKPAPVAPFTNQPPMPPDLLTIVGDECALDDPASQAQPEATRITGTKTLWRATCESAAYNVNSLLFWEEGGKLTPANFSEPKLDGPGRTETNALTGVVVDPEQRTVTSFARGRGHGDCGVMGRWIWDGVEFRLQSYRFMPECKGVPGEDWPDLMER